MARSPRPPLLAVACALVTLVVGSPAAHAETLSISDPITDNYKASYNADPSTPERRTWLAMRSVVAGGTTWAPAPPTQIVVSDGASVAVRASDGREGVLATRLVSGPLVGAPPWRVDPFEAESRGRWGPLATITDRAALQGSPATVALTLTSGGATVATGVVEYRSDAALAGVASDHIEYNGPGGRWYVGGVATRTNWEPVPATPPVLLAGAGEATTTPAPGVAPRVTSITLPLRTTKRLVTLGVRGRAGSAKIRFLRVRIDSGRYGRWVAVRPTYSLVLPRGTATRLVRVQLRDAAGRVSKPASRRVRCTCS